MLNLVGFCMTQAPVAQPQYTLEGVALLKGLPAESLKRIEQNCAWARYEPEEPIVEYLDRSDGVFFLVSGEARVIVYSLAGKVVSFHDLGPGDMFGELPAIDGRPRSASVEARTSCLVASIKAASFHELLRREPLVLHAVLRQLAGTIRRTLNSRLRVQRSDHDGHRAQNLRRDARHPRQRHLSG